MSPRLEQIAGSPWADGRYDEPRRTEATGSDHGGRYGIRTHGDPEATTAFEAAPFVRSGNLPATRLAGQRQRADVELLAASGEEVLQQLPALVGPNPADGFIAVVESVIVV